MKVYCIKKAQNGLEYYLSYDEKRYTTFLPHAGFYETRDEAKEILHCQLPTTKSSGLAITT